MQYLSDIRSNLSILEPRLKAGVFLDNKNPYMHIDTYRGVNYALPLCFTHASQHAPYRLRGFGRKELQKTSLIKQGRKR